MASFTICLSFFVCIVASHASPSEWTAFDKPSPDETLPVTFAIKQTNTGWLAKKLREVSYPDSPSYGKYMNFDEIAKYVHGRPESVKAVMDALTLAGVTSDRVDFTIGMDFAVASMTVSETERLFSAQMYRFRNKERKGVILRSSKIVIPQSMAPHVDFVSGVSDFPKNVITSRTSTKLPSSVSMSPKTIDKDYNISGYTSTNTNNSQAIAGFLGQYFDPSDLADFQKMYDIPSNPIAKVVGENKPDDPGVEASLDVQYITATGRNVDTWFISVSKYANGDQEGFLTWMVDQINTTNSPWVHSVSYGDNENSIGSDYIQRTETEFAKFGVSGRTLLFAAGDSGVGCGLLGKYKPSWPASSPSVTSVGGTVSLSEVWSDGGGGFSNVFTMPDYQKSVVASYLKNKGIPSDSHFNAGGRAYPDVSAFAVDFMVVSSGLPLPVDGTSCSAPTTAGIISLLNDIRLNSGKPTLGFMNPLLYQTIYRGFTDITKGSNGGRLFCKGFPATEGWDAASGWGSPNFGLLKDLV